MSRTSNGTITILILAAALGLATGALAWLGYRATREWRASAVMVAERRVDEVAALLINALTKDMRGAQQSILLPLQYEEVTPEPPYELADLVARAFARFPYPESFFLWRADQRKTEAGILFNRTDRPPSWHKSNPAASAFPVTVVFDSPEAYRFATLARSYVLSRAPFALFETNIGEIPYHVISRVLYKPRSQKEIVAVIGFTVNLDWVRKEYFKELTHQIGRIGGDSGATALSLTILDAQGRLVTQTRPKSGGGPVRERQFPLMFFDSSVSIDTLAHLPLQQWTAVVSAADDPLLGAADAGAKRTLALISLATAAAVVGMLLALRSMRTNAQLAAMKDDFVATVSHELKTPLASISLIGDTLTKGRYSSQNTIAEYGELLVKEASRLTRHVENLLRFSRITQSKEKYSMENVDISELVNEALLRFQPQFHERAFEVKYEKLPDKHYVYCDRDAVIQVFENVLDNAIKHSGIGRSIEIRAYPSAGDIHVSLKDRGKGIFPDELPLVFDKFFRGRNAGQHGSGLGLSIAQKIVKDHGGSLVMESIVDEGTTVTVSFPVAAEMVH